jgi:hypothetical protein
VPHNPENKRICGSRTCKPNSVCRIAPAGRSFLWAGHYCQAQATYPKVVTHRAGTYPEPKPRNSLPIWSCSVWGLPCPLHYCRGGALLPHLFTLTLALPPRRYVFCGTFRRMVPPVQARGTLPDVIRHTALRSSDFPPALRRATVRSGCLRGYYMRCWVIHRGRTAGAFSSEPVNRDNDQRRAA